MEKLSLYDLCIVAKSLNVDFGKLAFEEDGKLYVPDSSGNLECDSPYSSDVEYSKLSVLIRVLQDIYKYRPLPF